MRIAYLAFNNLMYAFCQNYKLKEVILWTRRDIYAHTFIAFAVTFVFTILKWKWIAIPLVANSTYGYCRGFCGGFQNNASYDRLWEARRIWGAIVNASRSWASWFRTMSQINTPNHPSPKMS